MILFGTPISFVLATTTFPGKTLLTTLFELPLVLPPAVAGLGLLMAFGRFGLLGSDSWTRSGSSCRSRRRPW